MNGDEHLYPLEFFRTDPLDFEQVLDPPKGSMGSAPVQNALREDGPDAREGFQLFTRGSTDVKQADLPRGGWRGGQAACVRGWALDRLGR